MKVGILTYHHTTNYGATLVHESLEEKITASKNYLVEALCEKNLRWL